MCVYEDFSYTHIYGWVSCAARAPLGSREARGLYTLCRLWLLLHFAGAVMPYGRYRGGSPTLATQACLWITWPAFFLNFRHVGQGLLAGVRDARTAGFYLGLSTLRQPLWEVSPLYITTDCHMFLLPDKPRVLQNFKTPFRWLIIGSYTGSYTAIIWDKLWAVLYYQ